MNSTRRVYWCIRPLWWRCKLVEASGDWTCTPRGPEVRAELTPLVPASLRLRSGHLMETKGSLFQPVQDALSTPQVQGQWTCPPIKFCQVELRLVLLFGSYFVSWAWKEGERICAAVFFLAAENVNKRITGHLVWMHTWEEEEKNTSKEKKSR